MRSSPERHLVYEHGYWITLLCVMFATAAGVGCGGDTGGDDEVLHLDAGSDTGHTAPDAGDSAIPDATQGTGASIAVEYPFLITTGGESVFPSYLAHLMGSDAIDEEADLACVTVTNTGGAAKRMRLEVTLQGYSEPASTMLDLDANQSARECMTPAFDLATLYGLSSRAQGTVRTVVTDADSGAVLVEESRSTPITSANTVIFRSDDNENLWWTVGVRVTPEIQEVREAYRDIDDYSLAGTFGTGGYRAGTGRAPLTNSEVLDLRAQGYAAQSIGVLAAGETLKIAVEHIQGDPPSMHLMTEDAYNRWIQGEQVQTATSIDAIVPLELYDVTAAGAGKYYLALVSQENATWPIVTLRRTFSQLQDIFDYLQATYRYLHDQGLSYVHVPATFFTGAQSVQPPEEALAINGANCIDGAVLFASVLELAGLDPIIAIVPGHAFVGAWTRPRSEGPSLPIFIETTMVEQGDVQAAFEAGMTQFYSDVEGNSESLIDIHSLRAAGLTPMPR